MSDVGPKEWSQILERILQQSRENFYQAMGASHLRDEAERDLRAAFAAIMHTLALEARSMQKKLEAAKDEEKLHLRSALEARREVIAFLMPLIRRNR